VADKRRSNDRESGYLQSGEGDFPQGDELRKWIPEQDLIAEILVRNCKAAFRRRYSSREQHLDSLEAYAWIMDRTLGRAVLLFTFEGVCEHLKVEPEWIREQVERIRRGEATPGSFRLCRVRASSTEEVAA